MKKLFTRAAAIIMGISMAAGVGVAIAAHGKEAVTVRADEEIAYTLSPASTGNNSYASSGNATIDGVTWTVQGNGTTNPWRIGGKSLSSVSRKVFSTGAVSDKNITKVVLSVGAASSITVNSLTLNVGTASQGSQTSTVTGTFKASSDITFNRPDNADWSNKYFTFDFNVTVTGTSNKFVEFKEAKFYYDNETSVTVTDVTGVSSHPSEVRVGGTINPDNVVLNVTFSDSTTGTVNATSVECDTSVIKDGVVATATYDQATGNKTATFTINVVAPTGYDLVNSVGSLRNGAQLVIYSFGKQKIMGNTAASSLRTGISLTVQEGEASFISSDDIPTNTEILTLVQSGSHWELKTSANKYLSLTSDANAAHISDNPDTTNNTTEWDITFSGNNALIQSVAYSARYLEANTSNGNFGCYKGTQTKVQLYILRNNDPYFSINMTSMYLGPLGTQTLVLTAHNKASDTVTWSTSNSNVASIPNNSTEMTVVVTGVAVGKATITATFGTPSKYEPLVCMVEVLELEPYVNVGVTTFTKTSTKPTGGWAGTYLIGDTTGKTILDGSLSPLPGGGENYSVLASLPDTVNATSEMISKSFTIKATETDGVYTIRSNSYYYIGNTTTQNGMDTSIGEPYEVSISDSGVITMNGTTLAYNTGSTYRFYVNLTDSIRAAALWRADGEMREITSTLSSWYSNVKSEEYLVCNASGEGSKINWTKLEETAAELDSSDLDTLENMAAKPSENGGNYLEDLISDYDYLVAVKNYNDFLGREAAGTLSFERVNSITTLNNANANMIAIIVIASIALVATTGAVTAIIIKKRATH